MSELFNIFSFTIFLTILFFMPFFSRSKIKISNILFEDYNLRVLNISILLNLLLIFNLLNFELTKIITIFYSFIFIFIVYFLTNFKKFIFEKNIIYFFIFYFFSLFVFSIELSNNLSLYWDAQKLWLPKAIVFFNDGLVSELKNTSYSHYSFLGSLLWAFFWKISNFDHEYFGRMFYLGLYIFSLINILSLTKIEKNIKLISLLLLILVTYDYWHFRGTQEILVFSFLLILTKYFFNLFFEKKNIKFNLLNIFLFLNLIIWTKNEGIILSLVILFNIIIFLKENLKFKLILLCILLFFIFIRFSLFNFYGLEVDLSKDFDFSNIFKIFINNFTFINLLIISKYILISFVKFPHIILSLFFAVLIAFDKRLFKKLAFLYIYLFLSVSLIFLIYLSSPQNMEFMVSTGSLRLMFEFSAPYLIFILVYFKERFKI